MLHGPFLYTPFGGYILPNFSARLPRNFPHNPCCINKTAKIDGYTFRLFDACFALLESGSEESNQSSHPPNKNRRKSCGISESVKINRHKIGVFGRGAMRTSLERGWRFVGQPIRRSGYWHRAAFVR
jgi:hypothetical protein